MIGYFLLVVVAVAAVEIHHTQTTNEIKSTAQDTCYALAQITDNQAFVMQTLVLVIARETHESEQPAVELISALHQVENRLRRLPKYNCQEGLVRTPP